MITLALLLFLAPQKAAAPMQKIYFSNSLGGADKAIKDGLVTPLPARKRKRKHHSMYRDIPKGAAVSTAGDPSVYGHWTFPPPNAPPGDYYPTSESEMHTFDHCDTNPGADEVCIPLPKPQAAAPAPKQDWTPITTTTGALTFSQTDEHGCRFSFHWDEKSNACYVDISFETDDKPVSCTMLQSVGADHKQHTRCSYKLIERAK